jgi:hypothetical protein
MAGRPSLNVVPYDEMPIEEKQWLVSECSDNVNTKFGKMISAQMVSGSLLYQQIEFLCMTPQELVQVLMVSNSINVSTFYFIANW